MVDDLQEIIQSHQCFFRAIRQNKSTDEIRKGLVRYQSVLGQKNMAYTIKLAKEYFHFRKITEHQINRNRFAEQIRSNNPKMEQNRSDNLEVLILQLNYSYNFETKLYFKDSYSGGYSTGYLRFTWKEIDLKCEADSTLFREIFEMDIRNGAEPTKLLLYVCLYGGWSILKVKLTFSDFKLIRHLRNLFGRK